MEARTTAAESQATTALPIAGQWPRGMYSLSHVALPFPPEDGLYGYHPDGEYDVPLGTGELRGERGTLVISAETLMRASCNPFFGYLMSRIEARIPAN